MPGLVQGTPDRVQGLQILPRIGWFPQCVRRRMGQRRQRPVRCICQVSCNPLLNQPQANRCTSTVMRTLRTTFQIQLNQSISADPAVVAQAAAEVDLARRQTQEVYDQATREIAATRALAQNEVMRQTREVYHRASQEVDASRVMAEREVAGLQAQVASLMHLVEEQRRTVTQLQQQSFQDQPSEIKSPRNGTGLGPMTSLGSEALCGAAAPPNNSTHQQSQLASQIVGEINSPAIPNPSGPARSVEVARADASGAENTASPRPVRGVANSRFGGPETGNPHQAEWHKINTPRIQAQLDFMTAQIASLTSAMSSFVLTGGRGGNAQATATHSSGHRGHHKGGLGSELGQELGSPISLALRRPPGPPPSGSSSSSGSENKDRDRKGRKAARSNDQPDSSSTSSSSESDDAYKQEKKAVRIKSYDALKLAACPKTAAEARGFRNQVFSAVTKLAKTDETPLLQWISATQSAGDASEFDDSGAYPLLDRVLGFKLLEAARGTKFSLDFQAVQETSQRLGYQPRGRLLLWMVFQRYRLEKDRGAAFTQHHLLSLTVGGNDIKGLEDFKQKFNYVWEALDSNERPTDNGVRSLLSEQLKNHPKMALHIDRYRNSSSTSSKRTWQWLYQKMQEVIEISHLDENTASIDRALTSRAANQQVPGNPAPKGQESNKTEKDKQKEKEKRDKEKKEREKAKKKEKEKEKKEKASAAAAAASEAATPTPAAPAKGNGKGKGKDKPNAQKRKRQSCHAYSSHTTVALMEMHVSISMTRTTCAKDPSREV